MAGDGAEILAHIVVARLPRLHAADLVGGPRHQVVLAPPARIPAVRPAHPHEALARRFDMGGVPGLAAVDADLDLVYGAGTAPGVAPDHVDPGRQRLGVVVGLGDDRFDADRGDQLLVRIVRRGAVVIELVVVPAIWLFLHDLE